MDPLSIIASVITVAVTTTAALEKARTFYGAEHEVLSLINEVADLHLILEEVSSSVQERGHNISIREERTHAIVSILKRAKLELETINKILNDKILGPEPATGARKIGRLGWTTQKTKLKRLQAQIKDTRLTLSTLCSSVTVSDLSHIQLQLTEFTVLHGDYTTQLGEQTRLLQSLLQQQTGEVSSQVVRADSAVDVSEAPPIGDAIDAASDTANEKVNILQWTGGSQKFSKDDTMGNVRIGGTRYRQNRCEEWCSCRCHQGHVVQTPTVTRMLIGSLFVGYSGVPAVLQKCTERRCRRQSKPTLKVAYHFPGWFLTRMIKFAISGSFMKGPDISLAMPRVVPDNSEVLACAVQGNLDRMRELFVEGLASPFDIGAGTGRSPLHYAVNYDNELVARFLVDSGADPQLQDMEHATTVSIAWKRIFGSMGQTSALDTFRYMFDDEEFLESRVFQPLHKIVLGLSSASLERKLQLSTSDIDDVDADGRTALSWAASRGDLDAVTVLLKYGADPNMASYWGQTPLHWIVQNKKEDPMPIMELLLYHGANVDAIDYWNRTALTYASGNHSSLDPVKLLVDRGTPLDVRDLRLRTALGYASRLGSFAHAKYLLAAGADPNLPDEFNVIPLLETVKNNYHEILQLLLPVSDSIRVKPFGSTLLHWIALYADTRTTKAFLDFEMGILFDGTETDMNDAEGNLPNVIFSERSDQVDVAHRVQYERLDATVRDWVPG